jgi:hypothetical protein
MLGILDNAFRFYHGDEEDVGTSLLKQAVRLTSFASLSLSSRAAIQDQPSLSIQQSWLPESASVTAYVANLESQFILASYPAACIATALNCSPLVCTPVQILKQKSVRQQG